MRRLGAAGRTELETALSSKHSRTNPARFREGRKVSTFHVREMRQLEARLVRSPATHRWLAEQIAATRRLDPVDALHDAETLVLILRARVDATA